MSTLQSPRLRRGTVTSRDESPGRAVGLLVLMLILAGLPHHTMAESSNLLASPQAQILPQVKFEQHLNAQLPLDRLFVDEDGDSVRLGDFFGDRPVLFVLAYYRCPMLCNQVLNGVLTSVNALPFEAGNEFEIVVISFDPTDSPAVARAKREAYTRRYHRENGRDGWHFLTGKAGDIAAVADAAGFRFIYDEKTDQFAHASGIMIATPDGRLAQYFYGIDYPTRDLRLALVEASQGKIGNLVDQVLLLCFHYDAITGRYGLAVMRLVQAGGILTVLFVGGFIFRSLRKERRTSVGSALRGVPEAAIDIASPFSPTERHPPRRASSGGSLQS
jgi:protein SCO1